MTPHTGPQTAKSHDAFLSPVKASRDSYYYLSFRNPILVRSTLCLERVVVLFCFEEKLPKTQWDHAASAYPAKATSLSFAFTFCGRFTQSISLLSPSTRSRILSTPPSTNLRARGYCRSRTYPQVRWWRRGELHPCPTQHSVCINN